MSKLGSVLNARPDGREAFLAISPTLPPAVPTEGSTRPALNTADPRCSEMIELDFENVEVLTPSFAEEFIISLLEKYPGRVSFQNIDNVTVKTTLNFLERQWPEFKNVAPREY